MALFSESATGDVHSPLCFRPVQQTDVFLGDPVVQTRLDNLESRQKGDTFQLRVAWVSLHELDEQNALSGSDGSEAETQCRGRLPLAVACVYHHQTMLFHCRLHCRDVINSIVPSSFPRMRESILPLPSPQMRASFSSVRHSPEPFSVRRGVLLRGASPHRRESIFASPCEPVSVVPAQAGTYAS